MHVGILALPVQWSRRIRSLERTFSGRHDDSDTERIPRQLPTIPIRELLRSLTKAHFGLGSPASYWPNLSPEKDSFLSNHRGPKQPEVLMTSPGFAHPDRLARLALFQRDRCCSACS